MARCLVDTLFVLIVCLYPGKATLDCDMTTDKVEGGNIGQVRTFSWLGVLRVHLRDGDKSEVALSGLVLIKPRFAVINADDIARIPEKVLKEDTQAMFVVAHEFPQFYPLLTYLIHPEYEKQTLNTVAVVELDLDTAGDGLPKPICWTRRLAIPSKHFYLTGYTDDNRFLEKVIYRMHYQDKNKCEDFYTRAELNDPMYSPVHYLCGVSPSTRTQCLWENGMVLVTNHSSYFALLGLSIRGPGCTLPARFIDLHQYYEWVQSATKKISDDNEEAENDARRRVIVEHEPAHDYFPEKPRSKVGKPKYTRYEVYPFNTDRPRYFNVDRVDNNTIAVFRFNDTFAAYKKACKKRKVAVYTEDLELKSHYGAYGTAYYKISLFDLHKNVCGCIIANVKSRWHSEFTIAYKEFIALAEGTAMTSSEETPEMILKQFLAEDRTLPPEAGRPWAPIEILKPVFITMMGRLRKVLNYDLYVRFDFRGTAKLHIEMYAEPVMMTTTERSKRRFAGLTPDEERLEFLKSKRPKMTRPPGRKKWYEVASDENKDTGGRRIRSGLVEDVPPIVAKTFDSMHNPQNGEARNDEATKSDSATFIREAMESIHDPEPENDFQRFFEPAPTFDVRDETPRYDDESTDSTPKYHPAIYKVLSVTPKSGTHRPVCSIVKLSIFLVQTIIFIM